MADPFDVLGGPETSIDPDPTFADRLRSRLERALALPRGVTVSDTVLLHPEDLETEAPSTAPPDAATRPGRPTGDLTPYLAVAGAEAAIRFYTDVFGAVVVEGPILMPDGRIGHAGLRLPGGAQLMLSEEHTEIGVTAPVAGAGNSVTLHLEVDDVDVLLARAVDVGAEVLREPDDNPYGRVGAIRDPFGHRWMLNAPAPRPDRREGDAGYVSLWVPDAGRAATFFGSVLGWEFEPANPAHPQSRHVAGRDLHHGIQGGVEDPTLFVNYTVADLDAALGRVRAAGGEAGRPTDEPWGRSAMCSDDQGSRFALFQPTVGVAGDDLPEAATSEGDLGYLTYHVVDGAAFRAFYGAVLGWTFSPGRVEDGWQIAGPRPMAGMRGGSERATTIPLYAVDDLDSAVERVRAAGGDAEEPEQQGYGTTSLCHDDQGTEFYLAHLV